MAELLRRRTDLRWSSSQQRRGHAEAEVLKVPAQILSAFGLCGFGLPWSPNRVVVLKGGALRSIGVPAGVFVTVSGASSPSNATVLARYRALLAFEAVTTVQQMPEMRKEDRWVATKAKYTEKVQCAFREGGLFAHPSDAQSVLRTTLSPSAEELDGEKIWALYSRARKEIRLVLLPAFDKTEAQSGKSTDDALKAARLAAYKLTKAGIAASDVPAQYFPMSWLAFLAYRDQPGVRPEAREVPPGSHSRRKQRLKDERTAKVKDILQTKRRRDELADSKLRVQESFARALTVQNQLVARKARVEELQLMMSIFPEEPKYKQEIKILLERPIGCDEAAMLERHVPDSEQRSDATAPTAAAADETRGDDSGSQREQSEVLGGEPCELENLGEESVNVPEQPESLGDDKLGDETMITREQMGSFENENLSESNVIAPEQPKKRARSVLPSIREKSTRKRTLPSKLQSV
eukprot:scaffold492_cov257-Pinguiococcus_pyrenoidosus.AAC.53